MKAVRALWHAEPLRVCTVLAAVVVFLAAKLGVVISAQSVVDSLLIVLPILLGGEQARGHVLPVRSLVHDYAKLPPDPVNKKPEGTS